MISPLRSRRSRRLSRPNFSATLKIVEKSGIYNTSFLCSLNAKVLNTGPGFVGRYRLAPKVLEDAKYRPAEDRYPKTSR
jgi:hypothetical protein